MKKAWLLIAASLLAFSAETIRWQGSYETAHRYALKEGKPLLVLLVKRRCTSCGEVLAKMNRDAVLVRLVNEKTVPVLVTKENEDYPIEMLYTLEFPSLFLLSKKETFLISPMYGGVDLPVLRRLLEKETFDE